eukprot:5074035-Amphidinium_carterae.1
MPAPPRVRADGPRHSILGGTWNLKRHGYTDSCPIAKPHAEVHHECRARLAECMEREERGSRKRKVELRLTTQKPLEAGTYKASGTM